jgi:hypothetical protein
VNQHTYIPFPKRDDEGFLFFCSGWFYGMGMEIEVFILRWIQRTRYIEEEEEEEEEDEGARIERERKSCGV